MQKSCGLHSMLLLVRNMLNADMFLPSLDHVYLARITGYD